MEISDKYHFVSFYRSDGSANTLDSDLYIENCGIERTAADRKYVTGMVKGYHILFVLGGKGILYTKKGSWKLTEGTIFLLPDGLEAGGEADSEDPWQYAWITINGSNASSCLKQSGFGKSLIRKCSCNMDCFVEIIDKILNTSEQTMSGELRRNSYLYEMMALLAETEKPEYENLKDPQDVYVRNAVQYIHKNYSHIKVNDIASYIGINRSYLTTLFKNKLNVSPQEYLVSYRLNKAKQLLQITGLSIREVAFRVGYDNPLTFSKMFKNAFGVSPKYYREEVCCGVKIQKAR